MRRGEETLACLQVSFCTLATKVGPFHLHIYSPVVILPWVSTGVHGNTAMSIHGLPVVFFRTVSFIYNVRQIIRQVNPHLHSRIKGKHRRDELRQDFILKGRQVSSFAQPNGLVLGRRAIHNALKQVFCLQPSCFVLPASSENQ